MDVADSSVKLLIISNSGRKTMKVTEWQWKMLSVADVSRKILVVTGRLRRFLDGLRLWEDTECC